MKNILMAGFCFLILVLVSACDNSFYDKIVNVKSTGGEVIIRISNPDGRTIMPVEPNFNRFELTLQKEGEAPQSVEETGGIDGDGISITLSEGKWTIMLRAFQDILNDGIGIPAAQGSAELTISLTHTGYYIVEIELEPIAIDSISVDKGLFNFNIILPEGLNAASLNLKDSSGNSVAGYDAYSLLNGNNTGSIPLAPGFYDLSIILTKNGQTAGTFESVHIYSGLISPADIDLSAALFADKVYLAGRLGGIRIGTIQITDETGKEIKKINLNGDTAERSDFWLTDIPAVHIGKIVNAALEFNGENVTYQIPVLEPQGNAYIDLNLIPESVKAVNLAAWYSKVAGNGENPEYAVDGKTDTYWNPDTSSTELILDYGFNVTVNFSRLSFYSASGASGLNVYSVDYWNGSSWVQLVQRAQSFAGSTDGSVSYGDFFHEVTAQKFRWKAVNCAAPAIIEFSLYNTADRAVLKQTISSAIAKMAGVVRTDNGSGLLITQNWASEEMFAALEAAIAGAQAVALNEKASQNEVNAVAAALNSAIAAFVPQKGQLISSGINYSYTFSGPKDETITLSGTQVLSWVKNNKLEISVGEIFDSYQWYVDGVIRAGETGKSITLSARDFSPASHTVTVRVTKGGIPYTKSLIFTVE